MILLRGDAQGLEHRGQQALLAAEDSPYVHGGDAAESHDIGQDDGVLQQAAEHGEVAEREGCPVVRLVLRAEERLIPPQPADRFVELGVHVDPCARVALMPHLHVHDHVGQRQGPHHAVTIAPGTSTAVRISSVSRVRLRVDSGMRAG